MTTTPTETNSITEQGQQEVFPALEPLDEHNRKLQAATHPPDWVNPVPTGRYNLVVIGAGTAGLVAAAGAAGLGAKVALIERHLTGGDCLNVGCVPSKALIRSAHAAADARNAGKLGVRIDGKIEVDFPAVMERMRRLRASIAPVDSVQRFKDLGIDVYLGSATFTGSQSLEVAGQKLEYSKAVIATGARAAVPDIQGIEAAGYLTNETLFSLTELPKRLVVIGGGPIGCEMAQAMARFGSQVTILQSAAQILDKEDPDAASIVTQSLLRDGVKLVCNAKVTSVYKQDGHRVVVFTSEQGQQEIPADAILISAGRAPNVRGMGLEKAGVEYDTRTGVKADDNLRTTNKHIYAAGDVCSRFKFTHTADAQARIVIQNALFFGRAKTSHLIIPWSTYTDPEIAHVGMYEHDADKAGVALDTYKIDLKHVDRAILEEQDEGFLKVHVKKGTDQIVGATIVAAHAGEMISEITLAMTAKAGLGTIARTIHPYPTQAEMIKKAGDAYSRTRLTPLVKSIFSRLMAWRR